LAGGNAGQGRERTLDQVAGAAAEHQPPGDGDPAAADWLRRGVPMWMLERFRMNGGYRSKTREEKNESGRERERQDK